ncbi:uncharacterized protein LOC144139725 [Haemaphysalis longicornis]
MVRPLRTEKPPTQSEALKLKFWRASEGASLLRRRLMPYTLTTLFKSSSDGTMLARPMYFEFPDDLKTHAYTAQFMYGPCVLVAPFLNPPNSSTKVKEVYLPEGVWYMYPAGRRIASTGGAVYIPALSDGAGAIITRGGSIIPYAADTRKVSDAATSTRPGSIGLAVSLDADEQATGEFFLMPEGKEGLEAVPSGKYSLFHFVYVKGTLMGHCSVCGMAMTLEGVQIFGLSRSTSSVDINGSPLKFNVSDSYGSADKPQAYTPNPQASQGQGIQD